MSDDKEQPDTAKSAAKAAPMTGIDVDLAKMALAKEAAKDPKAPKMVVPEGHRPEEFYNDAQLEMYYQQQLDDMPDDHHDKRAAKRALARAKIAAAVTAAVDPDLTD